MFVASRHAVLSVDKLLIWAARNMGTPSRTIFFRVVIPAAAPQLFGGIRIGLAHAFVVLFAAELIGSKVGLGTIISYGEEWVWFDLMFDTQTRVYVGDLPAEVLASISSYYRRVTTEAWPISSTPVRWTMATPLTGQRVLISSPISVLICRRLRRSSRS